MEYGGALHRVSQGKYQVPHGIYHWCFFRAKLLDQEDEKEEGETEDEKEEGQTEEEYETEEEKEEENENEGETEEEMEEEVMEAEEEEEDGMGAAGNDVPMEETLLQYPEELRQTQFQFSCRCRQCVAQASQSG